METKADDPSRQNKKEAMKRMAQDRGVSRREIYQGLLEEEQMINLYNGE